MVALAERRREPRLLSYYMAQGLSLGSLASVVTLLGDIRDEFGLTETQVGLIVGAGFFTAFVTQITLARVADGGHAPLMVRIGLVVAAASMVGFAASSDFWSLVASRAILGVSIGVAQPAIRRIVIVADPAHIGRNPGRLGVAEIVWFALTPAAAALLADAVNLDLPFYVLAAAAAVAGLAMGRIETDQGAVGTRTTNSLRLLHDPIVAGTLILVTSPFVMIGAWEAVWAVSLVDLGGETWEVGLSFTLFAIPLGALAPVAGAWAQRTGGVRLCVADPAHIGRGRSAARRGRHGVGSGTRVNAGRHRRGPGLHGRALRLLKDRGRRPPSLGPRIDGRHRSTAGRGHLRAGSLAV